MGTKPILCQSSIVKNKVPIRLITFPINILTLYFGIMSKSKNKMLYD